ncbi:MAG: hypothetical protein J6A48_08035 [Clostridia bacterium]|nr:hypothetical protein [Clostridia bacterium]
MIVFPIIATVYGAVVLIIGLIFLIPLRYITTRFDRTTTGKVIDLTKNAAKFNKEQGHEPIQVGGKDSPFRFEVQVGGRSRVSYRNGHRVHVTTSTTYHQVYTYTVNGQTYTRADGIRYSKNLAKKWLDKEVPVHYDSSDPSQASLSEGKGYKLVCWILIPIGIVLLGLAAWLWLRL